MIKPDTHVNLEATVTSYRIEFWYKTSVPVTIQPFNQTYGVYATMLQWHSHQEHVRFVYAED